MHTQLTGGSTNPRPAAWRVPGFGADVSCDELDPNGCGGSRKGDVPCLRSHAPRLLQLRHAHSYVHVHVHVHMHVNVAFAHAQEDDLDSNFSDMGDVKKVRDRAAAEGRFKQRLGYECLIFTLYISLFMAVLMLRRSLPDNLQMTNAVEHALHAEIDPSSGASSAAQVSPPLSPRRRTRHGLGVPCRQSEHLRWDHDTATDVGVAAGPQVLKGIHP